MSDAINAIEAALVESGYPADAAPIALAAIIVFLDREVAHEFEKALAMGDVPEAATKRIAGFASAARSVVELLSERPDA